MKRQELARYCGINARALDLYRQRGQLPVLCSSDGVGVHRVYTQCEADAVRSFVSLCRSGLGVREAQMVARRENGDAERLLEILADPSLDLKTST